MLHTLFHALLVHLKGIKLRKLVKYNPVEIMPNFFIFFPNGPFKLHVMLLGLSLCVKPNSHFNDNIKTKKKELSFQ